MLLPANSGSKKDFVGRSACAAAAHRKSPQLLDLNIVALRVPKLAQESAFNRIDHDNTAIEFIPNEQHTGVPAKTARCDCQPPGLIEQAMGCQPLDQNSVRIEYVDITIRSQPRIRNIQLSTEILHVEWRPSGVDI